MKEGTLDKIKSRGYWRVNFRPLAYKGAQLTLTECKEVVEKSSVQFRGWDYPHIPVRNDENGGQLPCGDYHEGWSDWWNHIEFWRMYKSQQYLHYLALREDWLDSSNWDREIARKIQPMSSIGVGGAIYQLTEIFEFAFRLGRLSLYIEGATIDIRLENTKDRALWIDDPRRMPFSYPRQTGANAVHIRRELTPDQLASGSADIALEALLEFFDNFGWNPSREQISSQQKEVLSGRF